METIRLIGRNSRLSILQLEKVERKIRSVWPGVDVQLIFRSSRGDSLQDIPLQTVEGSDFFTQDIFDTLDSREADIAVHSLKDMSSEHFFGSNAFAVIDRDEVRDVALFSGEVLQKIKNAENITIGTCSPRREEMATGFLQKALPQLTASFRVVTKMIRGNVDTRLRKLDAGEYDGIILAAAGLNRLLESEKDAPVIRAFLKGKRLMFLPLIECVPAPCQGAIVAEANPANAWAVKVLKSINDTQLEQTCREEKRRAMQYGVGCLQRFGVTTIQYGDNNKVLYAGGRDSKGDLFNHWSGLPDLDITGKNLFSTTDFMGRFFKYEYDQALVSVDRPVVYVANYKAVEEDSLISGLQSKRVWAAGTKTWLELAKKGIWVEGSADAFGLEFLEQSWQMPLTRIHKNEVSVITNTQSVATWRAKGWQTYGTYATTTISSEIIESNIKSADVIFWTSYRQYQQYKGVIKDKVIHACPFGETAEQLRMAGINPIVFPNIKAFQQWKQTSTRSRGVA